MPRIPLPTPESMTPEQRRVYEEVIAGPRGAMKGPLLAALHRPELAERWQRLGELLRYRTSFSARYREIAILITARACRCPFEWYMHEPHAIKAGVPSALISAIRDGVRPEFESAEDAAVYKFVSELHDRYAVSDGTYDRVRQLFGVVGVVELTALVGYYTMVAMTLNAHEFTPPEPVTFGANSKGT